MTVRVYRSTDIGAPWALAVPGGIAAVWDAVLVDGYGVCTGISITRADTTATVTLPAAHGLNSGTFVTISGAAEADYNGEFPITVIGATTFTYQVANAPATPATTTGSVDSTIFLLHAEGFDGQTIITDEVGHTFQSYGVNTRLRTFKAKFGTSSLYNDASGMRVTSYSPDYILNSDSFTFECWINPVSGNGATNNVASRIFQIGPNTTAGTLVLSTVSTVNPTKLVLQGHDGAAYVNLVTATTSTVPNDAWTHVAVVRNGNVWKIYLDGVDSGTGLTQAFAITASPQIHIGGNSVNTEQFYGYIDEVRLSRGVVYSANFTPPAAAFTVGYRGIQMRIGGAKWTRPYSGTNTRVYKQGVGSNGFYARLDNSYQVTSSAMPGFRAYEIMSDADTGVNKFADAWTQAPYGDNNGWHSWIAVASEKIVYMCVNSGYGMSAFIFGDIISNKQGDIYGTFTASLSTTQYNAIGSLWYLYNDFSSAGGHTLARAHTQLGGVINCGKASGPGTLNSVSGSIGSSGAITYPSPIDGGFHIDKVRITEGGAGVRGILPGFWAPLHALPFAHGDIINGTGAQLGKRFLSIRGGSLAGNLFLEISNTW